MVSCFYEPDMSNNNQITCKYLPYYFVNQFRFYPMVNVIIEHDDAVGVPALIDSGATNTFVPYGIAEAIGLLPKDTRKLKKSITTGASGKFPTLVIPLKRLQVFKDNHVFETFQGLPVYVADNPQDALPYVVLGRDSVFKRFDITFNEGSRKMIFNRR